MRNLRIDQGNGGFVAPPTIFDPMMVDGDEGGELGPVVPLVRTDEMLCCEATVVVGDDVEGGPFAEGMMVVVFTFGEGFSTLDG